MDANWIEQLSVVSGLFLVGVGLFLALLALLLPWMVWRMWALLRGVNRQLWEARQEAIAREGRLLAALQKLTAAVERSGRPAGPGVPPAGGPGKERLR